MKIRNCVISFALLLSISISSVAEEKYFKSWAVGQDSGGLYAGTMNDSKGVLAQYCAQSTATCFWILTTSVSCKVDSRYLVLVNSDNGAFAVDLYCYTIDNKVRFAFTDFDAIDGVVKNSSRIGIAFPMESGAFQVSRFELGGAPDAVAYMRTLADRAFKTTAGTKDQTF